MKFLRRILVAKPEGVRLANTMFAVGVGFQVVDVTSQQFALVIAATEAFYQYLSKIAFQKSIEELSDGDA